MAQRKRHCVWLTTITHIGVRLAVLPLSGGFGAALKTAPMRNIRSRVRKCKLGDLSQPGCQLTQAVKRRRERIRGRTGGVRPQPSWLRAHPGARVFETEKRNRTKIPAKCLTWRRPSTQPLLSTKPRPESSRKGVWLPKMSGIRTILLTFLNVLLTTPKLNPVRNGENRKAAIV